MASRGDSGDLGAIIRALEERVRALEKGTKNKGTVSFGAIAAGDIKMEPRMSGNKVLLVITRSSTGEECTIDPGNCVTAGDSVIGAINPEVLWAVDGPLVVGRSNAYDMPAAYLMSHIVVTLATVGTTDTVIELLKNGEVIAEVTVPAGTAQVTQDVGVDFAETDTYSLAIVSAGAGAMHLQTQTRFA